MVRRGTAGRKIASGRGRRGKRRGGTRQPPRGGGPTMATGWGKQGNTRGQTPLPPQARGVIDTGPAMPPVTKNQGTGGMTIADVAARMGETLVGPDGQPLRASRPIGSNGPNLQ